MSIIRNNYVLHCLNIISLSIILLTIANNSIYVHTHISETGEIITHAHPFDQHEDDAPIKSHEHSSIEFVLLKVFNVFLSSSFIFAALGVFTFQQREIFVLNTLKRQFYYFNKQNKSPPVIILSH